MRPPRGNQYKYCFLRESAVFKRISHDYTGTIIGKRLSALSVDERAFLLAEYPPLRDEVNRTVDRMNQNEAVCAAFTFTLIFASIASPDRNILSTGLLHFVSALLAVLVAFYGAERGHVFRRHLDMVEKYLGDIERRFSNHFGWTKFYNDCVSETRMPRQMGTRGLLWLVLRTITGANLIYIGWYYWPSDRINEIAVAF